MPREAISPTFTVELEGKTFPLRYEHRDFAEAEGRLGIPLIGPASLEMWARGTSAYQTGLLLFVGLLHRFPKLTLDQARAFISFENAAAIESTVTEAFQAALPARDEKQQPEQEEVQPEASPLAASDTGSSSGPSPSSTSDSQSAPSGD